MRMTTQEYEAYEAELNKYLNGLDHTSAAFIYQSLVNLREAVKLTKGNARVRAIEAEVGNEIINQANEIIPMLEKLLEFAAKHNGRGY